MQNLPLRVKTLLFQYQPVCFFLNLWSIAVKRVLLVILAFVLLYSYLQVICHLVSRE